MRSETGKRPQAPSNHPLQPLKRQNDMTFGQPRKLCLSGGVLPRRCKSLIVKEDPNHYFSGRFFRPCGIFEEGRISGFWGDLRGAFDQARPHARAFLSRETGPFLAFPLFRRSRCLVPTTRKTPRSLLLRSIASGVLKDSRRMPVTRWRCLETRCFASKLGARCLPIDVDICFFMFSA